MANPDFAAPYNWCDGKCARCPLSRDCPVFRRSEQRRWVRKARKQEPDTFGAAIEDMTEDLEKALTMLQEVAEKEGIDLDAPKPPQPASIAGRRVRNAGMALLKALQEGLGDLEAPSAPKGDAPEDAIAVSLVLTTKIGRIASYFTHVRDEVWLSDAVPNLLLVEHLRRDLDGALLELQDHLHENGADAAIQRALAEIDAVVSPLLKDVGAAERALLDQLIERREAPSPFCIQPERERA